MQRDRARRADSPAYWEEITQELAPAGAILILGHGNGKANASHHWVGYVEKHHHDVAAKIVADESALVRELCEYRSVLCLPPQTSAKP